MVRRMLGRLSLHRLRPRNEWREQGKAYMHTMKTLETKQGSWTRPVALVLLSGVVFSQVVHMEAPPKLRRMDTRHAASPASSVSAVDIRKRTTKSDPKLLVSSSAVRGDRPTMEDALFIAPNRRFAAVFDGHGGANVALYLKEHLYSLIVKTLGPKDTWSLEELEESLQFAFKTADKSILERQEWRTQGSTATAVFLIDDLIWSMNVGDSRAVLCRNGRALNLTRDHKPNDPIERARIEKIGGRVRWHGLRDAAGKPIPEMGAYRVNGNLAVARAFGDGDQRPFVSGELDLKCFRRDPTDKFIVLASDGLWDVFTSAEVVTFVKDVLAGEVGGRESWRSGSHNETSVELFEWRQKYRNDSSMIQAALSRRKEQMATYLTQEALYRGTADNVAVAVIWLDNI